MQHKLELELKWENNVAFSLEAKLDDNDKTTIISVEENGCIDLLWSGIAKVCRDYYNIEIDKIGAAMKEV